MCAALRTSQSQSSPTAPRSKIQKARLAKFAKTSAAPTLDCAAATINTIANPSQVIPSGSQLPPFAKIAWPIANAARIDMPSRARPMEFASWSDISTLISMTSLTVTSHIVRCRARLQSCPREMVYLPCLAPASSRGKRREGAAAKRGIADRHCSRWILRLNRCRTRLRLFHAHPPATSLRALAAAHFCSPAASICFN